MSKKLISSITQIAHHRNGICGATFYAVIFKDRDNQNMLAMVFENHPFCVGVVCLDLLPDVTFGKNSWRGDEFESELRQAIEKWEK